MKQIYIDNSILGRVCNQIPCDSKFAGNFDNAVLQSPHLPNSYEPLFSPFSVMEIIGLTVKMDQIPVNQSLSNKIKNAIDDNQKLDLVHEYWENIYKKFIGILDKDSRFTVKHIKKLQDKKISHIEDADIREKIKPFIQYDQIDQERLNIMKGWIAVDQVFNYNYREDVKPYIYNTLILKMVDFIMNRGYDQNKAITNFPFTRVISKVWNEHKFKLDKNDIYIKKYLDKITKNIQYKGNKDLMDTELIHFSVVGKCNDNSNKKDPVYCYTCDSYEKIKDRVSVYKGLIKYFFNDFQKRCAKLLNIDFDMDKYINMGKIILCDPYKGIFKDILDVNKVPEF